MEGHDPTFSPSLKLELIWISISATLRRVFPEPRCLRPSAGSEINPFPKSIHSYSMTFTATPMKIFQPLKSSTTRPCRPCTMALIPAEAETDRDFGKRSTLRIPRDWYQCVPAKTRDICTAGTREAQARMSVKRIVDHDDTIAMKRLVGEAPRIPEQNTGQARGICQPDRVFKGLTPAGCDGQSVTTQFPYNPCQHILIQIKMSF